MHDRESLPSAQTAMDADRPSLEDVMRSAAPAAGRVLRLLAPWDRARLRTASRALAAAVPVGSCAPCPTAMLRRGGPGLFVNGAPFGPPCEQDLYAALAADNPHAVRWLLGQRRVFARAFSDWALVKLAVAYGSVAVLRALLDRRPSPCDLALLLETMPSKREAAVLELARATLPLLDARAGDYGDNLDAIAGVASCHGYPSVMEELSVCAGAAFNDRPPCVGAALRVGLSRLVDARGRARMTDGPLYWAVMAGDRAWAAEELLRTPAPLVGVRELVASAAGSTRAYDMLCLVHGAAAAADSSTPDGDAPTRAWQDRVLGDAMRLSLDPSAGALRWLVERTGFVPGRRHLSKAIRYDAVSHVTPLARLVRPTRGYLERSLVRKLADEHYPTADALSDSLAHASDDVADDGADAWTEYRPVRMYDTPVPDGDGDGVAVLWDDVANDGAVFAVTAPAPESDAGPVAEPDAGPAVDPDADPLPATPDGPAPDLPHGLWLLLAIGKLTEPRARAYGAELLRRRGLLPAADGAFLRACDSLPMCPGQLVALAHAGYRMDADRAAWLDWLWPDRARPGRALDVLHAYRLHARHAAVRRDRP